MQPRWDISYSSCNLHWANMGLSLMIQEKLQLQIQQITITAELPLRCFFRLESINERKGKKTRQQWGFVQMLNELRAARICIPQLFTPHSPNKPSNPPPPQVKPQSSSMRVSPAPAAAPSSAWVHWFQWNPSFLSTWSVKRCNVSDAALVFIDLVLFFFNSICAEIR